jgi:hypothetical protein
MATKDTIGKIRDMLFPGSDAGDLSSDTLNTAILNINQYKSNSGRLGYVNLVRSLISKTQVGTSDDTTIFSGTPTGVGLYTPEAFGHGARLLRYKLYDSIVENISYCHRALNVIVDNILSPDDITKIALVVKPSEDESSDETDYHVKSVERLISKLNIEKYLQRIIKASLKSGDYFCEIADSKTAMTSQSFIAENEQYIADSTYVTSFEEVLISGKNGKDSLKKRFILDFSSLAAETESSSDSEPISEDDNFLDESKDLITEDIPVPSYSVGTDRDIPVKVDTGHRLDIENISDIHFLFHEGKHVIKLQSELYSICFGYLIFPKINILRRLNPQEEILNTICNKILKKVYEQIPQIRNLQEPDELKDIIKSIISRTSYSSNVIIRYVPPDRMTHFKLPCDKYFPYGESIFSSVEFSCKVLMALETSLAVQRINRSTEKRKIGIEIGLPRDARKLVEDLKMELNKRKVCLDDFSTIDAIPSAISTFEDMYVPQKDGTPFVDIQPYSGDMTDVRSKVDELKFLRDQIVAALGVPPAFIGIEENLSNKNALSNENILFARCIINYQKTFSEQITELIKKILICIDPHSASTLLDDITITFPTPRSLQYENESRWTQDLINMIRSLQEVGIPIEWSKKKYLTNIDWVEVEKFETDEKIDQEFTKPIDKDIEDTNAGGMGGGMGGLGMGGLGMDMSGIGGLGPTTPTTMPPSTAQPPGAKPAGDEFKF